MHVDALVGARSIQAAQPEIDDLRRRCGQAADVMTSLHRVQRWNAINAGLPVAFLIRRRQELRGVVWLSYRRTFGVVVGLVKSGNLCGQGSVIAEAGERRAMLETTARILLRYPLAHTVVLSSIWDGQQASGSDLPVEGKPDLPVEGGPDLPVEGVRGGWHFREVRFRLDLSGGFAATMDRLGRKMRRNLRYYRRRAEDAMGLRFLPDMTAEQRRDAVAALHSRGAYPMTRRRAEATEAALLATPGQFAMGLQDGSGRWLSYVAGWREPEATCIDWQLNHDAYPDASLSTVMRGLLLEHEAMRDAPAIVFVGLTSEFWSRVCEPAICGDLLGTRADLVGAAARRFTTWIRPKGQVATLHARTGAIPTA